MPGPFDPIWIAQINLHKPDPALDIVAMALDEYIESRDESLVIAKPAADLAMLEVARLPWKLVAKLDALSGNARSMFAFQAACHRVRVGATVLEAKVTRDKVNGVLLAPDSWLDAVANHPSFGPYAILEAGEIACQFAMLTAEQKRSFRFPAG